MNTFEQLLEKGRTELAAMRQEAQKKAEEEQARQVAFRDGRMEQAARVLERMGIPADIARASAAASGFADVANTINWNYVTLRIPGFARVRVRLCVWLDAAGEWRDSIDDTIHIATNCYAFRAEPEGDCTIEWEADQAYHRDNLSLVLAIAEELGAKYRMLCEAHNITPDEFPQQ